MTNITRFLTRLLQPLYSYVTYSTTLEKGIDVVDAIEGYRGKGFLQPNTIFATVYIHDLSTIIPHEQMIQTLDRFLDKFLAEQQHVEGIHPSTIIYLARLTLENQYLLYDNKLYQQIRGDIRNSSLTTLLANIYVFC